MEQIDVPVNEGTQQPAGEGNQNAPTGEGERLYAGKYKTIEEMEKGYTELQSKLSSQGQQQQQPPAETPKGEGEGEPAGESKDGLGLERPSEPSVESPIDFASYNETYAKEGKLSDEQYQELNSKGFPKEMVDVYLAGLKSQVNAAETAAHAAAGSQEQFIAMQTWAAANLNDADFNAYNKAVSSNDPAAIQMAVQATMAKFTAATGNESNLVTGNNADQGNGSGGGYASYAELVADQKDPRYKTDPAFRQKVEDRVKATTAF